MADTPPSSDRVVRDLQLRLDSLEHKVDRVTDGIYGNLNYGEAGFLREVREEVKSLRTLCEDLRDERRQEQAERRGKDKLITRTLSFTGVTNIVTLIGVIALVVTIWQSGIFGG